MTFAAHGGDNCVVVDDTPYVYARTPTGSFVMPARCRHRGGPLHLATTHALRDSLVCPWHGRLTPMARLRNAIPAVRRGAVVTAVVPHDPAAPHTLEHRPMSPDLCAGRRTADR